MPRALRGDYAPRAATRILAKDVGIAAALAARHGAEATFARAAQAAFEAAVAAGYGEADDAALYAFRCAEAPDTRAHGSAPAPKDTRPHETLDPSASPSRPDRRAP
jgi:hypothetical protein